MRGAIQRRRYSKEEKDAAINRFLADGESVAAILTTTGISRSTLYS